MPEIRITVQETQETTTTEALTVAPLIEVQRITVERRSGILFDRKVGEQVHHTFETKDEHFGRFCVVEPELLERLRLTGWFHDDKDYELISKQPFSRVLEGKPYQVVRLRSWDHSLFDAFDQRLPVAMHFSYIDGRVNDYSFDLKGLLKHLQGRDDVTIRRERYCDQDIHRIPGYNAGDTCGYNGLSFMWHPTAELFREYCALVKPLDSFGRYDTAHQLMGNDLFRIEPPAEDEQNDGDY